MDNENSKEPLVYEKQTKEKKIVVGFWLRLFSDMLDAILLGLFGFLLSIPLKGLFYQMGENGLWLGLCITFLYTGILQSSIGQGQSLAKKILKIQVLRRDGSYLSLPQSFFRYSVIALIFYNQWIGTGLISLFPFLNNNIFQTVYSFGIFFLLISSVVLVAFHPLKRGLHDMLVNSIVVRKGLYSLEKINELDDSAKTKRAFVIFGVCCLLLVGGSYFALQKAAPMQPLLKELMTQKQEIEQTTQLLNVSPNYNWQSFKKPDGTVKKTAGVNIFAFLHKSKFDDEQFRLAEVEKVINIVVNSYSKLSACDYINVQLRTGYNIGIWSVYYKLNYPHNTDGTPITKP
ncbi:MAG: RDD family protein [Candidatus Omnitrophica bacterium]|nr:RDD family protein [Candidatus Omnitrophota bacterium]